VTQSQEFTLDSAYRSLNEGVSANLGQRTNNVNTSYDSPDRSLGSRAVRTTYGYAAHSLPLVETVSPATRQNIISGRDVNLSALLIPYFNGQSDTSAQTNFNSCLSDNNKPDPRLNRTLNIGEFIMAFGVYKHIMCSVHRHRRDELDAYERDIVDMATRYNKGFYEYHRQFSLQAAAHLRYNNIPVDWSIRDNTLFCNIFANNRPNMCNICQSTLHTTGFCPSSVNQEGRFPSVNQEGRSQVYNYNRTKSNTSRVVSTDSQGRHRAYHEGREICNNFNSDTGCRIPSCFYCHVCIQCKGDHSKCACPLFKRSPLTKKR